MENRVTLIELNIDKKVVNMFESSWIDSADTLLGLWNLWLYQYVCEGK